MTDANLTAVGSVVGPVVIGLIVYFFNRIVISNYYERKIVRALKELSKDHEGIWFTTQEILICASLSSDQVVKYSNSSNKISCNPLGNKWVLNDLYLQEKEKPRRIYRPQPGAFN
ncbi:hypothetical protein [Labilibaculum euxinus]